MIVVMEPGASRAAVEAVEARIRAAGHGVHVSRGAERTIVGAIGDERRLEPERFEAMPGVERAMHVVKPYRLVSRECRAGRTVVRIGGAAIGGDEVQVIAGPCPVETDAQLASAAEAVARGGARLMRGGAFKPRTSPYAFRGLGLEGLRMLREASRAVGLPTVSEVTDPRHVEACVSNVDMLQIGTRNMSNFDLLVEVGRSGHPVLLKRGRDATVDDWLLAAEYVLSQGNPKVVLCERGVRGFDPATRNTLDLAAVAVVRAKSHLPVIVDPSHATGLSAYVAPMARAACAAGADGLMVEVHCRPTEARCDAAQALTPEAFAALVADVRRIHAAMRPPAPTPAPAS